jgi:hypothetical protein
MKTSFFSRPDPGRLRKAWILILIALVTISIAIPGMIFSKGSTLFALMYFAGFTLFFYALLHPWQKVWYYAIGLAIFLVLLIIIIQDPGIFLNVVDVKKISGHGAEDLAWAIGGIFAAGILADIIGIIRTLMYKYDEDLHEKYPVFEKLGIIKPGSNHVKLHFKPSCCTVGSWGVWF